MGAKPHSEVRVHPFSTVVQQFHATVVPRGRTLCSMVGACAIGACGD